MSTRGSRTGGTPRRRILLPLIAGLLLGGGVARAQDDRPWSLAAGVSHLTGDSTGPLVGFALDLLDQDRLRLAVASDWTRHTRTVRTEVAAGNTAVIEVDDRQRRDMLPVRFEGSLDLASPQARLQPYLLLGAGLLTAWVEHRNDAGSGTHMFWGATVRGAVGLRFRSPVFVEADWSTAGTGKNDSAPGAGLPNGEEIRASAISLRVGLRL